MMYKKMKEWEIGYERDEGVSLLGPALRNCKEESEAVDEIE